MKLRNPLCLLSLLATTMAIPLQAHNYPIYPVQAELLVGPDHIRVKIDANASYWFGGILEANFPEGEWPEPLRAKAKTYIDSHFILRADGQPLESKLVAARHIQEPWQNGMESNVAYELTYPLPANSKLISGQATFFDEWKKHMQDTGQLHGDPSIPQTWLTTIYVPSTKNQRFSLTLEQPGFEIEVAAAYESTWHKWKVQLLSGLNSPITMASLVILALAIYWFRSKLKKMLFFSMSLCFFLPLAEAHNLPYSYLEIHMESGGAKGSLTVHSANWATQLNLPIETDLLDPNILEKHKAPLIEEFRQKLIFFADSESIKLDHIEATSIPKDLNIKINFYWKWPGLPGLVTIRRDLFAYDPAHQTMVTLYESNRMAHQEFLKPGQNSLEYFTGTSQGKWSVASRFIWQGIHHIFIGPDHILFIVGLLLFGGTIKRLLTIVTSFTVAHSVTLGLAALKIFSPSALLIDCLVALSIIYIGVENLLSKSSQRDIRARISFGFGLIHGFGFAVTLQESGLPPQALVTSLFSFNLGVEVAQVCIVLLVTPVLAFIRTRNPLLAQRIATVGSVGIVIAGGYWFVQRSFFGG
jgi:hydrogenase/urease accessory protein HupE